MSSTARCVRQSAESANWLFSQMKTTGSFHVAARFIALVHRALAGGAVAEVRDRRLPGAAELRGQRGAAGVRDAGADDPVAAEDVEREVGDVHRAAEAPAVAGPLAEHLGHHPAQVGAGRDQVAVRAVVADEEVRVAHRARGADGDRLLADAAVRRADDRRPALKSSAARSSKRRISAICRYCSTRGGRSALMRPMSRTGGRWLNSMM